MPYKDKNKQKSYQNDRIKRIRNEWILENGPCVKCGSDVDLEVDHIDPATKSSRIYWSSSKQKREVELKKCQVLCCKCHMDKTKKQFSKPLIHGTLSAYKDKKCRCVKCKDSNAEWNRKHRLTYVRP